MRPRTIHFAVMFGLAGVAGLSASAFADWQSDLVHQLKREQNCEVSFFSRLEERKVAGHEIVFVRAHCKDNRAFDARRNEPGKPFKIQSCDVQAC